MSSRNNRVQLVLDVEGICGLGESCSSASDIGVYGWFWLIQ